MYSLSFVHGHQVFVTNPLVITDFGRAGLTRTKNWKTQKVNFLNSIEIKNSIQPENETDFNQKLISWNWFWVDQKK
jgi:hypothetical protein